MRDRNRSADCLEAVAVSILGLLLWIWGWISGGGS
jgi:hypothetical protein